VDETTNQVESAAAEVAKRVRAAARQQLESLDLDDPDDRVDPLPTFETLISEPPTPEHSGVDSGSDQGRHR
jgi:hypothetical protein